MKQATEKNQSPKQILKKAIKTKDVKFLVKYFFHENLTPLQEQLVRKIAFQEHKKLMVSAMTRWGKSWCVSRGVGLFILMNSNKKVILLGPQQEQASLLRDYMIELMLKCQALMDISDLSTTGVQRLKKKSQQNRQTFSNDCEFRVFSCHGGGENLMGFGLGSEGGYVIEDESALTDREAHAKIIRLLGDNPDKSYYIGLLNPWSMDCKAFEHWHDPNYEKFHVNWQMAIIDGRTTKEFIDNAREELTPLEFKILYDSQFPTEAEDSVFDLEKVQGSINKFELGQKDSQDRINVLSCDVSDKGTDKTVIFWGFFNGHQYQITNCHVENKSENTAIAGRIISIIKPWGSGEVNIDCIGLGVGVLSMVQEWVKENRSRVKVFGCHFGESVDRQQQPERFLNKKASNYFRLKEIFDAGLISIPEIRQLNKELVSIRWEYNSKAKIKILDPDKSPDYSDALVYFTWFRQKGNLGVIGVA